MIGNSYNNATRAGQILLITMLVIATIASVVFSAAYTSRTNTQTTKLEEENQKALAAAEASIRVALKNRGSATLGSGELSSIAQFQGGAAIVPASSSMVFLTPSIEQDGEYTFYPAPYTAGSPPLFGPSAANDIRICFGSTSTPPALDIGIIRVSDPKIIRYAVDPQRRIANVTTGTAGCAGNTTPVSFSRSITISGAELGTDARFIMVKVLFSPTTLLFVRASGTTPLPPQGTLIQSTATSNNSGVTKKIDLFQSYPQIPIEFFSTTL
jgi:hypothetical protein